MASLGVVDLAWGGGRIGMFFFLGHWMGRLTYVTHIIETLYCMYGGIFFLTFLCHSFLFTLRFCPAYRHPTGPSPVFVSVNDLHSKVLDYRNSKLNAARVLESFQLTN